MKRAERGPAAPLRELVAELSRIRCEVERGERPLWRIDLMRSQFQRWAVAVESDGRPKCGKRGCPNVVDEHPTNRHLMRRCWDHANGKIMEARA